MSWMMPFIISALVTLWCVHSVTPSVVSAHLPNARSRRQADDSDRTLCQPGVEVPNNRVDSSVQLAALRDVMMWPNVSLDAYLIPYEDEHINTPADYDKRLQFISGFSGSYGLAWVLGEAGGNKQVLFTDGRYTLQADQQLDCTWQHLSLAESDRLWLINELPVNATVGIDPRLVSVGTWKKYEVGLRGLQLVAVESELIDYIWTEDRPARPNEPLFIHNVSFSGKPWQEKVDDVREAMVMHGADVLFLSALDDTAWLFNLRGYDRSTSPFFYSYAIITDTHIRLYLVNCDQLLTSGIQAHLNTNADGSCGITSVHCVTVHEYSTALAALRLLAGDVNVTRIWTASSANYAMFEAAGNKTFAQESPIQLMKAVKNTVERRRYKECQVRDSAAVVDFVSQLETMVENGDHVTELSAAALLESIRAEDDLFVMSSFEAISAFGANAAVIHYAATTQTDTTITDEGVYMLDSGGQYYDGTTDVTRTFHFGQPTDMEIEAYTRVLIGAIDLATTVWPVGLYGSDIDARARAKLWQYGWDYNHATGHGIGYFLSVHEGPGVISLGYRSSGSSLLDGMLFSDEPGFYEDGSFGIRLETIVEVIVKDTPYRFNDKDYLGFNPVTLVPFEPHLINYEMLSKEHRVWLNDYNRRCISQTGSLLLAQGKQQAYHWLIARTRHIPEVPTWSDSSDTSGSKRVSRSTYLGLFMTSLLYLLIETAKSA